MPVLISSKLFFNIFHKCIPVGYPILFLIDLKPLGSIAFHVK
uniref:Uncharacterized protein n=1 Tax=Arundo donax TaxID=35708 RepID=A0A0A9BPR1_ARUDO